MEPFCWSSGLEGICDGFSMGSNGCDPETRNGSSLVLDTRRGELVKAKVNFGKKGVSSERSNEALRNHCVAERNRRARINAHLDTLRTIVPGANKMDKATLLAEVITHMKELKRNAAEASRGLFMPTDIDELSIKEHENEINGSPYLIMVSLCCDHKPGLLSDLRKALDELQLELTKAEIATLEGRMKNILVVSSYKDRFASSVNEAIRSILDKFSATNEFSLESKLLHKRRRISLFDPSFPCSSADP